MGDGADNLGGGEGCSEWVVGVLRFCDDETWSVVATIDSHLRCFFVCFACCPTPRRGVSHGFAALRLVAISLCGF